MFSPHVAPGEARGVTQKGLFCNPFAIKCCATSAPLSAGFMTPSVDFTSKMPKADSVVCHWAHHKQMLKTI